MVYDLELNSAGKTYADGTVAVSGFDLKVEKGEFVAFLGPSGCGKSTTLRMIAGVDRPDTGRIWIDGVKVFGPTVNLPPEARGVGLMFQDFALFPHLTVAGNIALAAFSILSAASGHGRAVINNSRKQELRADPDHGKAVGLPRDKIDGKEIAVAGDANAALR